MRNIKLGFLSAILIAGLGSGLFLVNSCKHDEIPADQMPVICFERQVLHTFQNNCAVSGCHDGNGESGYIFNDYQSIRNSGAVVPGNPDKSPAYQAMSSAFQLMPPHNPLPENKRAIIRLWIQQGALETTCDSIKSDGTN